MFVGLLISLGVLGSMQLELPIGWDDHDFAVEGLRGADLRTGSPFVESLPMRDNWIAPIINPVVGPMLVITGGLLLVFSYRRRTRTADRGQLNE